MPLYEKLHDMVFDKFLIIVNFIFYKCILGTFMLVQCHKEVLSDDVGTSLELGAKFLLHQVSRMCNREVARIRKCHFGEKLHSK